MNFGGIDLHKKTISICVVSQARKVLDRKRFYSSDPGRIVSFFEPLRPFQAVVKATASHEWLFKLAEPPSKRSSLRLGLGNCAGEGTPYLPGIG